MMAERSDDTSLIAACRNGQSEAFGQLVRRYQDRLYPTMLRLAGRPEDALDLLQDAFLRAYEKLDSFHGESSFYTWIYRIAVNLALSDRRKKKSRWRLFDGGDSAPAEPEDVAREHDPSLPLERAERDERIQAALNTLIPEHRAVVVMKEFDGLRYEEIAEILDVPVGTVRSRLHRARSDLRTRLSGLVDDETRSNTTQAAPLS